MLSFYSIVILVAIVILTITLTIVGVTLTNKKNTIPFPDYQNTCPDFWTNEGTFCTPPQDNINKPPSNKIATALTHDGVTSNSLKNAIEKIDVSDDYWVSVCDKSSWAKKAGILWDGVTNNNTCI